MKRQYRVFPDWCSSGIWETKDNGGANIDMENLLGHIPPITLLAFKYWHDTWMACGFEGRESDSSYYKQWVRDGQTIVDAMNACQDEYEFIYCVKVPK